MIVTYRIDELDRIVSVGGDWNQFAAENGAPGLVGFVQPSSLWDHIDGSGPRQMWRQLLLRARDGGQGVMVPFSCDSPTERRSFNMMINRTGGGGLEFQSSLMWTEVRPAASLTKGINASAVQDLSTQCSWCERFRSGGKWVELEDFIRVTQGWSLGSGISHGICPDCFARISS